MKRVREGRGGREKEKESERETERQRERKREKERGRERERERKRGLKGREKVLINLLSNAALYHLVHEITTIFSFSEDRYFISLF